MSGLDDVDLGEKLHKTFHLASLRMLAELGLSGQHQSEALSRIRHYDQLRQRTEKYYRATYDDRVTAVMKKLIRQSGQKTDTFDPAWGGRDAFDKSAMRYQAEKQVRFAHQTSLGLLDTQEARDLEAIAKRADTPVRKEAKSEQSQSRRAVQPFRRSSRSRPRD